jgi:carboxylate-amine ligase
VLEEPFQPREDDYLAYTYNRFQACRFGLDGEVVDARSAERQSIRAQIAQTLKEIEPHATDLQAEPAIALLRDMLGRDDGADAAWLRAVQAHEQYLPEVVRRQCLRFEGRAI